mgnify:CR=1 FL=1
MSNVAQLLTEEADRLHLGPATIVAAETRVVEVRLEGGRTVSAELALAIPYVPAVDDVVLVLGKDDRYFVVGVMHGSGQTTLSFQGDVKLHASGGSVDIAADRGVRIRGRELSLEAMNLQVIADEATQKFNMLYQRVRGLWRSRSKNSETLVDEAAMTRAKTATILTEETMSINGKQIHLG